MNPFSTGYHSRFNPECNSERGFIDSLSIALGYETKLIDLSVQAFNMKSSEFRERRRRKLATSA